ncbi:MAG TPA: hypothetical protein VKA47_07310, partial [Solirubrobacterales bacterium]|nr:hypothetical protein [Solirubrobacterales bacterium]
MSEGPGTRPMVIVGGGKAGGTAAATLRDEGFNGPVVLVSREPGIPFGPPHCRRPTCDPKRISTTGT